MPDPLSLAKIIASICLLAAFWLWETWRPAHRPDGSKLWHAFRNLALAIFNSVVLALLFGAAIVAVTRWTEQAEFGLLRMIDLGTAATLGLAILLLDLWMYAWHRANHVIPLLWRFHRMHHSDPSMDVTTATRFHIGEHVIGATLRLGVIALAGMQVWHVIAYEILVVVMTQFHHANISLGWFDRWLRLLIVTPDMHKVHHSRVRQETNSNYSTVFSFWDRLARSFRMRADVTAIHFGIDGLESDRWQTIRGMLGTPFAGEPRSVEGVDEES